MAVDIRVGVDVLQLERFRRMVVCVAAAGAKP